MTLQEIYADKKKELDAGYMDFWNTIREAIENDDEYSLADDELDELIYDLMISNVLGKVARYDDVSELTKDL
jgi:hypothetical protein